MIRVVITRRYEKSLRNLHPDVKKAASKAILTLSNNLESRGLHLEPLGGWETYSIRATLNYRILLLKKEDKDGLYYSVEDIAKHDIYYKRR